MMSPRARKWALRYCWGCMLIAGFCTLQAAMQGRTMLAIGFGFAITAYLASLPISFPPRPRASTERQQP